MDNWFFWKDLIERSVATFAAAVVGGASASVTIYEVDWQYVVGAAALSALVTAGSCFPRSGLGSDPDSASVLTRHNLT